MLSPKPRDVQVVHRLWMPVPEGLVMVGFAGGIDLFFVLSLTSWVDASIGWPLVGIALLPVALELWLGGECIILTPYELIVLRDGQPPWRAPHRALVAVSQRLSGPILVYPDLEVQLRRFFPGCKAIRSFFEVQRAAAMEPAE